MEFTGDLAAYNFWLGILWGNFGECLGLLRWVVIVLRTVQPATKAEISSGCMVARLTVIYTYTLKEPQASANVAEPLDKRKRGMQRYERSRGAMTL